MDTSNLTFTISQSNFITIKDSGHSLVFSAKYVQTVYINDISFNGGSTVDHRWINDASTIIYDVSYTNKMYYF